jgi:membrane protein YdbS with pleckstrin-like domain
LSWPGAPERPAVAPPPRGDEPPARRLASGAKWAWRLQLVGVWVGVAVVGSVIANAINFSVAIVFAGSIFVFAAAILFIPPLRYRRWRWDLRPDVIDIQHGTFTVRRTLVPLVRVQHVDTKRGLLEQMLDLSTVVVHTAAGSHTIPYLSDLDADELRDRIAALARAGDA